MNVTPKIQPNYLTDDYDRSVAINIVKFIRNYAQQAKLGEILVGESLPGIQYQSDAEILQAWDKFGACGNHLIGTCRMGSDANSVVDPELRVRGVIGLSVMDCSIVPFMVAGNTNGPMMAMAGRAADLILSRQLEAH
jgi:choline dehydrogenase-like flavoprotein